MKIQRELCRPKSFGTFEKQAPGEPFILHMTMVSTKSAKINRAYYDHKMGKMKIIRNYKLLTIDMPTLVRSM